MTDPDDDNLVERAQAGERASFAVLVERYWTRVCHWLMGLVQSRETAEDLTQASFMRAWEALPRYTPGAGFRAWLFRIARNAWIDHCRRGPPPISGEEMAELPATTLDPAMDASEREFQERLASAVARLPVEFRIPWVLRMEQGMKSTEVACVLDIGEETVRWRVFRARQLLLKDLADYFDSQEPQP